MINNDEDEVFLDAIRGTKPLKKSNKNTKKIPKTNQTQNKKYTKKPATKDENKTTPHQKTTPMTKPKLEKMKINKKIKNRQLRVDSIVDFHGLSVNDAKNLFLKKVDSCYHKNKRCILFITGKGIKRIDDNQEDNKLFYGKIRAEFLGWTKLDENTKKILSVERASQNYGGDGAFFVYLRKRRN